MVTSGDFHWTTDSLVSFYELPRSTPLVAAQTDRPTAEHHVATGPAALVGELCLRLPKLR